ncbi:MAG TPA: type II toxin-antitoxin system VapC family toxin [Desulfuromonadales bacterium]|nr:type II toxin-antitoxin system VapC family toxin [Desulfuromonadales bacterium]
MGGIILDTNVLSELMRSQPDPVVLEWFARQTSVIFYTTAITQAEIMLGVALLPAGKRRQALAEAAEKMFREDFFGNCLPFDESCSHHYAYLVANRRRSGFSITTEDAQIAAIALNRTMPLATRNTKDFLHIEGLTLHNPWFLP